MTYITRWHFKSLIHLLCFVHPKLIIRVNSTKYDQLSILGVQKAQPWRLQLDFLWRSSQNFNKLWSRPERTWTKASHSYRYLRWNQSGMDYECIRSLLPKHVRDHIVHKFGRWCHSSWDQWNRGGLIIFFNSWLYCNSLFMFAFGFCGVRLWSSLIAR